MGGDGGVIASDRRYMRGAGAADHTGDSKRASKAAVAEAEREAQIQTMTTCAITGATLDYRDIVACPLGRLYGREAAVEALLRRMESGKEDGSKSDSVDLGWHVRGLKDLNPVRFQLTKKVSNGDDTRVPVCPITSVELNGIQPAFLIVKSKNKKSSGDGELDDGPNVLSEKGMKEMGSEALQEEYGPFKTEDLIRLAPPIGMLDEIKAKLKEKRQLEKASKKSKKKRKKEEKTHEEHEGGVKRIYIDVSDNRDGGSKRLKASSNNSKKPKTVNDVRSNVENAVASNTVLSSLFSDKTQSKLSEKEKKDKLFTSNC